MSHAQQQILDQLQALLIAGATAAGSRVFVDRVDPLQPEELPAILIEEGEGGEAAEVYGFQSQKRTLDVTVNCVVTQSNAAAAAARELGLAVEKLTVAHALLRALCSLGLQIDSSRLAISGDGDRLLAARVQSWRFAYEVAPAAPDVIL